MGFTPRAPRTSPDSGTGPGAAARRRWNATPPARLAAVLLLVVWVGPVTFAQTDGWSVLRWAGAPASAWAGPRVIPSGVAMELEPGRTVKLHLRDGTAFEGRYFGRELLEPELYAPRFAARALEAAYVPFALGETLHVSLRDGREWSAPFAGYAELTLLLRAPGDPDYRRVPFESAREFRRANGETIEPGTLAREFRAGSLPSAEVLVLWESGSTTNSTTGASLRRVPVEDIQWAAVEVPAPASPARSGPSTGSVVGIVVLGVALSVVLVFYILGKSIDNSSSQCRSASIVSRRAALGTLPLTTRPFDRDRGCYLGDPLAVADPWPGELLAKSTDGRAAPAMSPSAPAP